MRMHRRRINRANSNVVAIVRRSTRARAMRSVAMECSIRHITECPLTSRAKVRDLTRNSTRVRKSSAQVRRERFRVMPIVRLIHRSVRVPARAAMTKSMAMKIAMAPNSYLTKTLVRVGARSIAMAK